MRSFTRVKLSGVLIPLVLLALLLFVIHTPSVKASQQAPPIVTGWGGSRLLESSRFHQPNSTSKVFPNENASDLEMQARLLVQKGFNGYRASFAPYCTNSDGFFGAYNATQLERSIEIATHYGLWIIVDYHGYNELKNNSTATCWETFWHTVVQQFTSSYDRIIWEPLNEPNSTIASIVTLSSHYQQWVDQARDLGDDHWIVIENLCSFRCDLPINQYYSAYPTVNDPAGKLFISLHTYFDYRYNYYQWSNATADAYATAWVQDMVDGTRITGWPVLNTEGGPGRPFGRLTNGTMITCPDMILNGSSGFCRTNFHFIQTLTNLLDSQTTSLQTRLNWLWFPMADWSSTPGAGIYGSLSPVGPGWGTLLSYKRTQALSFTLNAAPNHITVYPGDSKNVSITAYSTGFAGITNLTTSWSSIGPTSSLASPFLQLSTGGSNTTAMTITVPHGTQIGTYNLTVTGSIEPYGSRAANIIVEVQDFTITADQQNVHILVGQQSDNKVILQSLGNFDNNVTLSVTSSSLGSNTTVFPQEVMVTRGQIPGATVSFNSTIAGVYNVTIFAKSGPLSHSTSVYIIVEDFEISTGAYASSLSGTNRTFMVQVTSLSDFSGNISFHADVNPNEPSLRINPQELFLASGGTSNTELMVGLPSTLPSGNYTVIIYATGRGVIHKASVIIAVSSQNPPPSRAHPLAFSWLQYLQIAGVASVVVGVTLLVANRRRATRLPKLADQSD